MIYSHINSTIDDLRIYRLTFDFFVVLFSFFISSCRHSHWTVNHKLIKYIGWHFYFYRIYVKVEILKKKKRKKLLSIYMTWYRIYFLFDEKVKSFTKHKSHTYYGKMMKSSLFVSFSGNGIPWNSFLFQTTV